VCSRFFFLCLGEIRARVPAQVGREERLGFGQRDVLITLALALQT
jgi:hypothetical protein